MPTKRINQKNKGLTTACISAPQPSYRWDYGALARNYQGFIRFIREGSIVPDRNRGCGATMQTVNIKYMPTKRINQENENEMHFLTLTIIEWIDIFTKPEYFKVIIDSLKYCRKNKGLKLYEYVIMTNHIHLIVKAEQGYKLSQIISDFKKYTTREILK
ncbi:transposase, partial [Candidatus Parcubacteria bacterium]|nr:transposase [Candidatus Parcubacteria bacterium]